MSIKNSIVKRIRKSKLYNKIIESRRNYYSRKRQRRLQHRGFTTLSINCAGGVISHDLNLQHLSPTVNLYFSFNDFMFYVENLKEFKNAELIDITPKDCSWPICKLVSSVGEIKIVFLHYKSFDEAKDTWFRRTERINYNDIFVITDVKENLSQEQIDRFEKLPYRKVLLSNIHNLSLLSDKSLGLHIKEYDEEDFTDKNIMMYKTKYMKYLNRFDYVEFFNNGVIREDELFLKQTNK